MSYFEGDVQTESYMSVWIVKDYPYNKAMCTVAFVRPITYNI